MRSELDNESAALYRSREALRAGFWRGRGFLVALSSVGAPLPVVRQSRSTSTVWIRVASIGVAVFFVLSACAGSNTTTTAEGAKQSTLAPARQSATAGTTTLRAPSSTTSPVTHEQVVAAVQGFWDLYLRLGARSGPFDGVETRGLLRRAAHGDALLKLYIVLRDNAAAGFVVKGTIDIAPRIVSATEATAVVRDCQDDKTGVYHVGDGKRIDKDDPLRHRVLTTLEQVAGRWTVSDVRAEGLGCVA